MFGVIEEIDARSRSSTTLRPPASTRWRVELSAAKSQRRRAFHRVRSLAKFVQIVNVAINLANYRLQAPSSAGVRQPARAVG